MHAEELERFRRVLERQKEVATHREAIELALDRIARGDYDRCEDCGEEIATTRLENEPTATRCAACQSRVSGDDARGRPGRS
jgi:RNA polymerase-binding transcription factor DksA